MELAFLMIRSETATSVQSLLIANFLIVNTKGDFSIRCTVGKCAGVRFICWLVNKFHH